MNKQAIEYPLSNSVFLRVISNSFKEFVASGTSRSTAKLKPLHGAIAADLSYRLGKNYSIMSQGYDVDKEGTIVGRYIDKKVDITILKGQKAIAGIAVKFVMQNYSQNSNNYFENMLGETANIRSNHCPYFQIFIILDKLPYYNREKKITKWETFTDHNIKKYFTLSKDNVDVFFHTPNKTLIYVVHIPETTDNVKTLADYMNFYKAKTFDLETSAHNYGDFGSTVIVNDYKTFIDRVYHTILAL